MGFNSGFKGLMCAILSTDVCFPSFAHWMPPNRENSQLTVNQI